jgi:hypothetical protein
VSYWRVDFNAAGAVTRVSAVDGPANDEWVVVEAPDEERARRAAIGIYCARKKRLARERNRSEGRCVCGRRNDRLGQLDPRTGNPLLSCSVCGARHKVHRDSHKQRKADGVTDHKRDESARVATNLGRQRDRRGEIRLETLIEVRDQWIHQRNVALFGQWLTAEIERITGAKAS